MNKRKMEHARQAKEEKHHPKSGRKARSRSKETARSGSEGEDDVFSPRKEVRMVKIKEPEGKGGNGRRSSSKSRKVSAGSKSKGHRGRSKSK